MTPTRSRTVRFPGLRQMLPLAALSLLIAAAGTASAQSTQPGSPQSGGSTSMRPPSMSPYDANRMSLLPYTRSGYIGFNVGRPDYDLSCPFDCDDSDWRAHLYTGGLINGWLGAEVGYQNEGRADRAGGITRAEGINISAVMRAPLGAFNVYAKLGGLYGRTRVSASALSGLSTGKDDGWGATYALGAGYDFTPNAGVVLEWARNEYRFRGQGRENVDSTNLGLVYRF